jgi:hypothetical protein
MYKARLRTVSYACEHCDHEWEIITSDITSDGARPGPDGLSVQPRPQVPSPVIRHLIE